MHGAYDNNGMLIAYHDRKKVVDTYIENVYAHNHIILKRKRIPKIKREIIQIQFPHLFLIPYNKTYIQNGFLKYLECVDDNIIYDTQYAIDVIYRVLEWAKIGKNKKRHVLKAIKVLEELLADGETYTPSYDDLCRMKDMYDPYIYNYKIPLE